MAPENQVTFGKYMNGHDIDQVWINSDRTLHIGQSNANLGMH